MVFGPLLHSLSPREAELRELYLTTLHNIVAAASQGGATPHASGDIFEGADDAGPGEQRGDRAAAFAEAAVQGWVARLRDAASDPASRLRGMLDSDQAHFLAQELVSAGERVGLARRLSDDVRALAAVTEADWENAAERAAAVATIHIGDIVADLGYGPLPPERRPQMPPFPQQARRRAFEPPEPFDDLPALSDKPRLPAADFRLDWLSAFVQLAQDNIGFSGTREIGEDHNAALGRILERARHHDRVRETA